MQLWKSCFPTKAGSTFPKKRWKFSRKKWVEQDQHKWNSRWHPKCTSKRAQKPEIHIFTMDFANFDLQWVPSTWHFFGHIGVAEWPFLKILLTCNFQNYASHLRRGAQFQKHVQKLQEEGVLSHKTGKKKADDARKTKKIRCVADSCFCWSGSRG